MRNYTKNTREDEAPVEMRGVRGPCKEEPGEVKYPTQGVNV